MDGKIDTVLHIIFGLLFIGVLGWYALVFVPAANRAIDAYAERKHSQWLEDKARCEELGGVATQSAWDGSITSCQAPTQSHYK